MLIAEYFLDYTLFMIDLSIHFLHFSKSVKNELKDQSGK